MSGKLRRDERDALVSCVLGGQSEHPYTTVEARRHKRLEKRGLLYLAKQYLREYETHDASGVLVEAGVTTVSVYAPTAKGRKVVAAWRQTFVETGRGSYVCQGLLDRKTCEGERALRSWHAAQERGLW